MSVVKLPKKRLFPTENAFRAYAGIVDLLDRGESEKGVLIAEIAQKCHVSYGSAYYWVRVLSMFGFITKEREQRKTANSQKRWQIVIRWNKNKSIADLEKLVDCDRWTLSFYLTCNPPLPKTWPLPKK